ncbi:CheW domain-containing protein [Gloeothece verrucosa]|uniref:CheW protein n=1 Tax=Gloeothece verrucosa (strain PCC 7822) TaxID=497965 RepID=E0UFM6_GLOV7|nr:CheW domain-containing protein [Gloeothece verrucosa]ADN13137.1 CheW protein [Gloeothece verrucosa PCC 7822]
MTSPKIPAKVPLFSSTNVQEKGSLEQFLRFYLVPDTTVILPLTQLTEVLSIPLGQIIPIPQMPSWIMGVYNWRGEILWMVDLGQLLGLTPWHQQSITSSFYRAIVLHSMSSEQAPTRVKGQVLGLVVSQVEDIEWCNPQEIQSPPASAITPCLAPFLRGYWLKPGGKMMVTLDGEAIMAALPKP